MQQLAFSVRNVSDAQLAVLRDIFGEIEYRLADDGELGYECLTLPVTSSTVGGDARMKAMLEGRDLPAWVWNMPTSGVWSSGSGSPSGTFSSPQSLTAQRDFNERIIGPHFTREESGSILDNMERPWPQLWAPAGEQRLWQRHLATHPDQVYRVATSLNDPQQSNVCDDDVRVSRSIIAPAWYGLPGMQRRTTRYLEAHRGFETPASYAAQLARVYA